MGIGGEYLEPTLDNLDLMYNSYEALQKKFKYVEFGSLDFSWLNEAKPDYICVFPTSETFQSKGISFQNVFFNSDVAFSVNLVREKIFDTKEKFQHFMKTRKLIIETIRSQVDEKVWDIKIQTSYLQDIQLLNVIKNTICIMNVSLKYKNPK